jgi:hypothetical protein
LVGALRSEEFVSLITSAIEAAERNQHMAALASRLVDARRKLLTDTMIAGTMSIDGSSDIKRATPPFADRALRTVLAPLLCEASVRS